MLRYALVSLLLTFTFTLTAFAADKQSPTDKNTTAVQKTTKTVPKKKTTTTPKKTMKEQTFFIDKKASHLHWVGKKKFVNSEHDGTVQISSGNVKIDNGMPKQALVVVDMTSIVNLDQKDKKYNKMLVDHLNSEDFFHVKKHKEARLMINAFSKKTKVDSDGNNYDATGFLTVRGKTSPAKFSMNISDVTMKSAKASGVLTFDRSKHGVSYRSESNWFKKIIDISKDKVIADEIILEFTIVAKSKESLRL